MQRAQRQNLRCRCAFSSWISYVPAAGPGGPQDKRSPEGRGRSARKLAEGGWKWMGRDNWVGAVPIGSSSSSLIEVCPSSCGGVAVSIGKHYASTSPGSGHDTEARVPGIPGVLVVAALLVDVVRFGRHGVIGLGHDGFGLRRGNPVGQFPDDRLQLVAEGVGVDRCDGQD